MLGILAWLGKTLSLSTVVPPVVVREVVVPPVVVPEAPLPMSSPRRTRSRAQQGSNSAVGGALASKKRARDDKIEASAGSIGAWNLMHLALKCSWAHLASYPLWWEAISTTLRPFK